jgi:Mor family transcriptional regulator
MFKRHAIVIYIRQRSYYMEEIMKYIEGTNKLYAVTREGKIMSFVRKSGVRELKQSVDRQGYAYVNLNVDGKQVQRKVHHLVAEAYLNKPKENSFVLHKNDDRLDNRADNLYYGSKKDNAVDAVINGKHGVTMMSVDLVNSIRMDLRHTNYKEVAKKYGVRENLVYHILTGRTWGYLGDLNLTEEQWAIHKIRNDVTDFKLANEMRDYAKRNPSAPIREISDKFGISYATTRRIIRGEGRYSHLGAIEIPKSWKKSRVNYEISQQILADFKAGMRIARLAEKYNVDISGISRLVNGKYKYAKPKTEQEKHLLVSKGRKLYAKHVQDIRDAYSVKGQAPVEIAKRRRIDTRAVRRILRGEFGGGDNLLPAFNGTLSQSGVGTYYTQGTGHINAKLSEEAVEFIRKTHRRGEYSQLDLADMFGVSGPVIYYANTGATWQHV